MMGSNLYVLTQHQYEGRNGPEEVYIRDEPSASISLPGFNATKVNL